MRLLLIALVALLLVGCSGGADSSGDRVLVMNGYNETEGGFRAGLRTISVRDPMVFTVVCSRIKGLAPRDALTFFDSFGIPSTIPNPEPWQTPRPGQERNVNDATRAAEIFQEECKALSTS